MSVCVRTCVCIHACVYVHVCIRRTACMCACVCVGGYVIHVCAWPVWMSLCACVHICVCVAKRAVSLAAFVGPFLGAQ